MKLIKVCAWCQEDPETMHPITHILCKKCYYKQMVRLKIIYKYKKIKTELIYKIKNAINWALNTLKYSL